MKPGKRRSLLEHKFESILKEYDVLYEYEITKIPYIVPESSHKYTVDWTLQSGILLETKGYLADYQERLKYQLIKLQHPTIDLRFVFQDPNKLCGGTKMKHSTWADKQGFKWCSIKDTEQLASWFKE